MDTLINSLCLIAQGPGFSPIIIPLLIMFMGLAILPFWIWMIIDCATREPAEGNERLIWIIIIVFAHWIGALIYFFVRRPKRIELYGK